jgi:hypothetical protein
VVDDGFKESLRVDLTNGVVDFVSSLVDSPIYARVLRKVLEGTVGRAEFDKPNPTIAIMIRLKTADEPRSVTTRKIGKVTRIRTIPLRLSVI